MSNKIHPIEILVRDNQERLRASFDAHQTTWNDCSGVMITEEVTAQIIDILNLNAIFSSQLIESFRNILKKHSKKRDFSEYCKIIAGWAIFNKLQSHASIKLQNEYVRYLKRLISYYESLANQSSFKEKEVIIKALGKMNENLGVFSRRYFSAKPLIIFRDYVFNLEHRGLCKIFKFYAMHHLFIGKSPTFQKIKAQTECWDCGLFIQFCKEFNLYQQKASAYGLAKSDLLNIFKKNSILCASMNIKLFLQAFDDIAEIYFSPKYDENFVLKSSKHPIEVKRVFLVEKLRIGDLLDLKERLKQLTFASLESCKDSRIPNSASSNSYKFTPSEKILARLKSYKISKQSTPIPNFSRKRSLVRIEKRSYIRHSSVQHLRRSSDKVSIYDSLIYSALK